MTHRVKNRYVPRNYPNLWRPHLESLEARLAPGDAVWSALLRAAIVPHAIAAPPGQVRYSSAALSSSPVADETLSALSSADILANVADPVSNETLVALANSPSEIEPATSPDGIDDLATLVSDPPMTDPGPSRSPQFAGLDSGSQAAAAGSDPHAGIAPSYYGGPIPQTVTPLAQFSLLSVLAGTVGSTSGQSQPNPSPVRTSRSTSAGLNPPPGGFACSVSLVPDKSAPQFVGEPITWTATAINCGTNPVFQFSAGLTGGPLQMMRDFSATNTFTWAPMQEGTYDVRVTVKDGFTATDTTSAVVTDVVNSRVTGTDPVVTPTANPLVALYSAPPTLDGAIHVNFRPIGKPKSPWASTDTKVAVPGLSTNFLVAGMLPNTTYEMVAVTSHGRSARRFFTTGALPADLAFPQYTVVQPPDSGSDLSQNMIVHMAANGGPSTVSVLATDLTGNVEWYVDPSTSGLQADFATSLVPGGTVLMLNGISGNVLQEVDLAGNTLRQTNLGAVNAQLAALGLDPIVNFSHDAQRLPDGKTAILGQTVRMVDMNGTPRRYLGDMVLVLDENFQVTWAWNAFDFLDVNRGPIDEDTSQGPVDWTHANAVNWSPADGNLVVSLRNQDWVIKIDYADGTGDGHVIWRLGLDGDFTFNSQDPYPWSSHQHDAHFINDTTLALFDNGKTRGDETGDYNSRGQVLTLDEQNLTATPVLNAYLNNYSQVYGSAQELPNGNFVFDSGFQGRPPVAQSIELLPDGTPAYVLQGSAPEFRSFRTGGLYDGDSVPTAAAPKVPGGFTPSILQSAPGRFGALQVPRVITQTANDSLGVSSARVTFNEPIDPTTFTPDQVSSFMGPNGDISILGVNLVAGSDFTQFDITFAGQTTAGSYSMVIGPDILDDSGTPMDVPYLLNFTLGGPRVIASSPAGNVVNRAHDLRLTFNDPIDPNSFTPAQVVQFTGPNGDISVTGVTPVLFTDYTQFNIRFATQHDPGLYSMVLSPDIQDVYGNSLAAADAVQFSIVRNSR